MNREGFPNKKKWNESAYLIWLILYSVFSIVIMAGAVYAIYWTIYRISFFFVQIILCIGILLIFLTLMIPEILLCKGHIESIVNYNHAVAHGILLEGRIMNYDISRNPPVYSVIVEYQYQGSARRKEGLVQHFGDPDAFVLYVKEDPVIKILSDREDRIRFVLFEEYLERRKHEVDLKEYAKRKDGSYIARAFPDYTKEIKNPRMVEGLFRRKLSNYNPRKQLSSYIPVEAVIEYTDSDTGIEYCFHAYAHISRLQWSHLCQSEFDFPVNVVINELDPGEYRVCLDETFERILEY